MNAQAKFESANMLCSTQSHLDNAQMKDASWMCAFCKRGTHTADFGDLFGPYMIRDQCFNSIRIAGCADNLKKHAAKRKSNVDAEEDAKYEVWAHEDCIVWSPGIYLVGRKIVGLAEAVWMASDVSCVRCPNKGANVCCWKRGCANVMHLGCAQLAHWHLDDDDYRAFCSAHTPSNYLNKRTITSC